MLFRSIPVKKRGNPVHNKIISIKHRIEKAAMANGRDPALIQLVAVSKTMSAERVKQAILGGATILGENYIQESREKIEQIPDDSVKWHFIGHLQSNKVRYAVKLFDLIHSVDSFKLAREINKQAAKINKIQSILIQVNLGGELTKFGTAKDRAAELARQISALPNLSLQGLMTMPPFFNSPEKARPFFKELRLLANQINELQLPGISMNELSMGMTGDFEEAIAQGATLVRIGTAIFGERS